MREKIKSIILFVLIINSLILTSLLNFYNFNDNTVSLSEYYPQVKFGVNIELDELIKPTEIIFHLGDNTHTVVRADNSLYDTINKEMRSWTFYNISLEENIIKWDNIVKNNKGFEVIFSTPLINDALTTVFKFNSNNKNLVYINRIWVFQDNEENIQTYFISDGLDKVYIAKVLISDQILNNFFNEAKSEMVYSSYKSYSESEEKLVQQMYYLPNEGLEIDSFTETYNTLSEKDLIQMLFIDPNSVRNVYEEAIKKTVLYTDGINSLQHNIREKYISYYQPVLEYTDEFDLQKDTNSAVKFINQHGGWDGTYLLENVERKSEEDRTEIVFRKYINGIPLYEDEETYGVIKLKIFDGLVSIFQRSIILIDKSVSEKNRTLSGNELLKLLNNQGVSETDIKTINLIYKVKRVKNEITLDPYWLINIRSEDTIEILANK